MKAMIPVALAISLLAQGQTPSPKTLAQDDKEKSARRRAFMKETVTVYDIYLGKERKAKLSLRAEPILRWNNPVSGVKDGTVFVWTADGRPEVVVAVFDYPQRGWMHEFTSLSPGTLSAQQNSRPFWYPSNPGIQLKPIPGAASPAETVVRRLRQMYSMTQGFTASSNFQGRGWWELRRLPKPLYRYGKSGTWLLDGALFAFVQGTNPEVLLLLEARSGEAGYEWHYALAPMTYYAVRASLKGRQIWSLDTRSARSRSPNASFFRAYIQPTGGGTEQ